MTMKRKTLSEAAAEVLQATRASHADPMQKVQNTVPVTGDEEDLSGSSSANPDGNGNGQTASAVAKQTKSVPGVPADPASKAPMQTLEPQVQNSVKAQVEPPMMTPNGETVAKSPLASQIPGQEDDIKLMQQTEELTAEEIEEAKQARHEMIKEKMKAMSCKEDIDAIFAGQDLSEEFKKTVTTIFEAAVVARAVAVTEALEAEILAAAEQSVDQLKEELDEQVELYLDSMVEEWMKTNEVAVEKGLRAEIVEEFMSGLKGLFEENNISLPTEQVDVVEALAAKVEEVEAQLNDSLNKNAELVKQVSEAKKLEVLTGVCEGLTATQSAKLKTLAEGVEFTTEGEYKEKLVIMREQYFNKDKTQVVGQVPATDAEEPVQTTEEVSPQMQAYLRAIKRTAPK